MAELLMAVRVGDAAGALTLLGGPTSDQDLACSDDNGRTALHFAAEEPNMLQVVERLCSLGANANAKNAHGVTPLHRASRAGHTDIILVRRSSTAMDRFAGLRAAELDSHTARTHTTLRLVSA